MNYVVTKYSDNVMGTSLQEYVETSYRRLHKLFGEPIDQPDPYKVSTQWVLEWDDGAIATIYDYKETKTYDSYGPSVDVFRTRKSYTWHIGGRSEDVVVRVQQIIDEQS